MVYECNSGTGYCDFFPVDFHGLAFGAGHGQIRSENRIFRIKAQADPMPGDLASDLLKRIKPKIEAIELPAGYHFEWGGEEGNSKESNSNIMSIIPMSFLVMVLVVVILFGKIRQPLVIWLVVPLALIGVVFGLVVTRNVFRARCRGKPCELSLGQRTSDQS